MAFIILSSTSIALADTVLDFHEELAKLFKDIKLP